MSVFATAVTSPPSLAPACEFQMPAIHPGSSPYQSIICNRYGVKRTGGREASHSEEQQDGCPQRAVGLDNPEDSIPVDVLKDGSDSCDSSEDREEQQQRPGETSAALLRLQLALLLTTHPRWKVVVLSLGGLGLTSAAQ